MHRWFAGLMALLSVATARGGDAAPLRLTVEEAVAHAAAANLEFRAARKDVDVAQAAVRRSKALLPSNPYVTGGAQHSGDFGANYSFLVSQEFEIGGQRRQRVAAAAHEVERAGWEAANYERHLTASVKTAFVHALVSAARVTLVRQAIDAAGAFAGQMEERPRQSDLQRLDVLGARIQDARVRRELATAEQEHDRALLALRHLVGLPLDQAVELVGAPESRVQDLPPVGELVARALRQRPDLIALRHAMQHGDEQVAAARRAAIPNLTVSGMVSRFEGSTLLGGDIGVPLPIVDAKGAEIQAAVAERARARFLVQNLEREIEKDVMEARLACTVAAGDLDAFQRIIVPTSEEKLRLHRRLYARGEANVSSLMGVAAEVAAVRREHLDALEAYNTSLIELDHVTTGLASAAGPPPAQ